MAEFGQRTGGLRDEYDSRDIPLFPASQISSILSSETAGLETSSQPFILPDLPPVYNQLDIGSCTANASCAALRYANKKATGKKYEEFEPSRLFAYYYGRITGLPERLGQNEDNSRVSQAIKTDSGSNNRRIIHTFLMQGVCKEELWPYGTPSSDGTTHLFKNTKEAPNPCEPKDWATVSFQAKNSSHPFDGKALSGQPDMIPRSISYYRIFDSSVTPKIDPTTNQPTSDWSIVYNKPPIALLEQALLDGHPFIFGTRVWKGASFAASQCTDGVYLKPPTGQLTDDGGHALMAVGFDSAKRLFLIQNSWGEGYYGAKTGGRFWMPYEWFELVVGNKPAVYDYWVVKYTPPK
jgi:C1A family cysteine protease